MAEFAKFTCSSCGQEHDEWPLFAFFSPDAYDLLSNRDKKKKGTLDSNFCTIKHSDQTDRFILGSFSQKVIDSCVNLEYELWVSVSEESFKDYSENFKNDNYEAGYFGWLSNRLPDYVYKEHIPTSVFKRTGDQCPEIIPHKDFNHPLVWDYYNGITKAEAEGKINDILNVKGLNI